MKILKRIALMLIPLLLWAGFIAYGFMDGFLLNGIPSDDTPASFISATEDILAEQDYVGSFAMTLVEDGASSQELFYSAGQPVGPQTVFQMASVSKWITAFGINKLVEEGKLNLDMPVDDYLTRWHLPETDFDNNQVTIRRLLSHSAGLIDDLGYAGYASAADVQTVEESLTKPSDAPWSEGIAIVGHEPGSRYMYSGASYTILQLVIEEVSGLSFQDYMTQTVFKPLGMNHSTFVLTDSSDLQLAELFQNDGTIGQPKLFTALAAASLYTCTEDLSKFMIAHVTDNPVVSQKTINAMSEPQSYRGGTGVYGLGPNLYSQGDEASLVIGHDGNGASLNTTARIDLKSKDGITVIVRGNPGLASAIADEWLYSKTGIADYVVMQRNIPRVLTIMAIGALLIIGFSIFFFKQG